MKKILKALVLALVVALPILGQATENVYKNDIFCIQADAPHAEKGKDFVLKLNLSNSSDKKKEGKLSLREIGKDGVDKYFTSNDTEEDQVKSFKLEAGENQNFYFKLKAKDNLGKAPYPITLSIKLGDIELVDRVKIMVDSDIETIMPESNDGAVGEVDILAKAKDLKEEDLPGEEDQDPDKPDLPDDFDPDQLPDGFDPDQLPDGFDPDQFPDGFDPDQLPDDFDPNSLLPGKNPGGGAGGDINLPIDQGGPSMSLPDDMGGGDFNSSLSGDVKNKPKLIIDKYSFDPKYPKAGEDFTMNLSFFNTNKDKGVRNIKISLTADSAPAPSQIPGLEGQGQAGGGSVFTPVNSSNTFFIDYIDPKASIDKTVVLNSPATLATGNYQLVANFEYEDKDGNEYTAKELIGIPIVQEAELTTSPVNMPKDVMLHEPVDGEIQFYNTGKDTLYNLMVRLEGDFEDMSTEEYVGNFSSGDSSSYMFNLSPSKEGSQKGKIIFEYEDATGTKQKLEKDFKLTVSPDEYVDPDVQAQMDMAEETDDGGLPILWFVGLAIVVIAIVVAIVKRRKKKKQEEEELTIDED